MNAADTQYLALCERILSTGVRKDDRTGTGTYSTFGAQLRFDLNEGFPLLTTKRVPFRIVAEELLWFLRGSTDVGELIRKDVNIWNADAYRSYLEASEKYPGYISAWGAGLTLDEFVGRVRKKKVGWNLGAIYGEQWRSWQPADMVYNEDMGGYDLGATIDQIANVIESIRTNPDSRRHIVSAWNVGELDEMALPPCHTLFQFYVSDGRLSCQLYQRSADVFLGLPFNIASYALLTHMIADITGLGVGEFVHTLGDAHIYTNHVGQVRLQMTRTPKELPKLAIRRNAARGDDPADFTIDDFEITGYEPHPPIKGEVSVGLQKEAK